MRLAFAFISALLGGCVSPDISDRPAFSPLNRGVSPSFSASGAGSGVFLPSSPVDLGEISSPVQRSSVGTADPLYLDEAPLDVVVRRLAAISGRAVIVEPGSYPPVSLTVPGGVTEDVSLELLKDTAAILGAGLSDGVGGALSLRAPAGGAQNAVARVVFLRHRRAEDFIALGSSSSATEVVPGASSGGVSVRVVGRALIIQGERAAADQLVEAVRRLDVSGTDGWATRIVPSTDAAHIAQALPALLGSQAVVRPWGPGVLIAGPSEVVERGVDFVNAMASSQPSRTYRYDVASIKPEQCVEIVSGEQRNYTSTASVINNAGSASLVDPISGILPLRVVPVSGGCVISGDAYAVAGAVKRLREADRQPHRVQIDAALLEVSSGQGRDGGLRFVLNALSSAGRGIVVSAGDPTSGGLAGRAILKLPSLSVALDLVLRETGVRLVSQPTVLVDLGETATLQAGDQVPVLDRVTSSDVSGGRVTQQITYRDVGVVLKVTPESRRGDFIRLSVSQEVSDATRTTTSDIQSPTISRRAVTTVLSAPSGQTQAMGGLLRSSGNLVREGLPVVSDLPFLGDVLTSSTVQRSRTELVLLVTATLVDDAGVAAAVQRSLDQLRGL